MHPFIASQKMREESQVLLKQIVEVREWEYCVLLADFFLFSGLGYLFGLCTHWKEIFFGASESHGCTGCH